MHKDYFHQSNRSQYQVSISISFSVTLLLLGHSKQNLGLLMVRCVDYIVLFGYKSSINQDESNPNIQAIMGSIPHNGCI